MPFRLRRGPTEPQASMQGAIALVFAKSSGTTSSSFSDDLQARIVSPAGPEALKLAVIDEGPPREGKRRGRAPQLLGNTKQLYLSRPGSTWPCRFGAAARREA